MRGNSIALIDVLDNGLTVILSNGSKFRIDPFDRSEAGNWRIADDIECDQTSDDVYNYTLLNTDINTWIRAKKLN